MAPSRPAPTTGDRGRIGATAGGRRRDTLLSRPRRWRHRAPGGGVTFLLPGVADGTLCPLCRPRFRGTAVPDPAAGWSTVVRDGTHTPEPTGHRRGTTEAEPTFARGRRFRPLTDAHGRSRTARPGEQTSPKTFVQSFEASSQKRWPSFGQVPFCHLATILSLPGSRGSGRLRDSCKTVLHCLSGVSRGLY